MPKLIPYTGGALVYYYGDKADKVFVLQKGMLDIVTRDPETNKEIHDRIQPGEFFGVKQALGNYMRDETVTATMDSVVLAFGIPEFEAFAADNTRIIGKMLKVFSTQLRKVNKELARVLQQEDNDPDDGLFNVGNYFLKSKQFEKASYVFKRYVEEYPNGKNLANARMNLTKLQNSTGGR
ncbi:hypothetical protein FACS1894190_18040 [Spirochaetia bacterium]|nr:hypothetical protein FACS1894190_18040 [Spirochaetia bacterium]GHV19830.1 hypothetical protein FACS189494_02350 [Spirochaetia bacterium]